ncbi:uncharacterized protein [Halyomorpha halys]|uniref:uncharacterized protein n=1 Tax=Halyomorpha halys TaxID=286706 RepID=UPI0034D315A6
MNSRLSTLLTASVILFSYCKGLKEPLDTAKKEELRTTKGTLQPNVTKKTHSMVIYEEVLPPTIIESDEPTDTILQGLTSEIAQAELVDAEADEVRTEEGLRQKRRAGRVVIRVCNRRRRRRCRYVIVIRRRRRRRY